MSDVKIGSLAIITYCSVKVGNECEGCPKGKLCRVVEVHSSDSIRVFPIAHDGLTYCALSSDKIKILGEDSEIARELWG
jgi:hypothetical protein